jgi:cell division protein FtsZ
MIQIAVPEVQNQLRPRITVFGIGGAGGNAVNNMIRSNLEGVEFVVANSDAQALAGNLAERKLQLGVNLTRGLGAGAKPEVGRAAAEEQIDEIMAYLEGSNMVFITAGMGGGTGTGAAPVIARAAREQGILTVGVVTKPFHFEGAHRMRMAEAGMTELQQYVDTLIIIPNQNLFRIANEKTTFADAFRLADEVLHSGVRGVTDLMVMPGLINLDFADIRSVMSEMGKAMMGTGEASGEKRSVNAAEAAIANPLLDDVSMKGARGVLINITGGYDMTLFEVDEAANRIREEVDADANIIFGSTFDEKMEGKMRVSVVATGIDVAEGEMTRGNGAMAERAMPPLRVVQSQQPAKDAAAARNAPSFTPGFTAPAAAQQSASARAPAAPQQPAASSEQPAAASLAAPFSWGLMGQNCQAAPTPPQAQPTPEAANAAALQNLLERARAAEAVAVQAEAANAQKQSPAQASSQPQQMSMPVTTTQQFIQPQPDYVQAEHERQNSKRSSSLFARIAGGFGGGSSRSSDTVTGTPQVQPKLGIDPNNRPQLTSEEETLEIPTFLRNQSN